MSNPNTRVAEIIAHSSGSSGVRHSNTTSASTDGIIARTIGNSSRRHDYLADNAISSHDNLLNSASTIGKLEIVYVKKKQYPISIIQLAEVLDISWKKKAVFDLLPYSVGPLSGAHSVLYFIMLMDNEVPMET